MKLRETFSKFYRRHYELISKFNVGLKTLLRNGRFRNQNFMVPWFIFKKLIARSDLVNRKLLITKKYHFKKLINSL